MPPCKRAGLRPDESLAVVTAEIHSFVAAQYRCWNEMLLPAPSRRRPQSLRRRGGRRSLANRRRR
jgi:polyphosphate kinase